jgi:hypothetical protein
MPKRHGAAGWAIGRVVRKEAKETRKPRIVTRLVLVAANVLLDSLSFVPGVAAMTELKDGVLTVLDGVQDIDDGHVAPVDIEPTPAEMEAIRTESV